MYVVANMFTMNKILFKLNLYVTTIENISRLQLPQYRANYIHVYQYEMFII